MQDTDVAVRYITEVSDDLTVVTVSSVGREGSMTVLYRRGSWEPDGWEWLPPAELRLAVHERPWSGQGSPLAVSEVHARMARLARLRRWPGRWTLVARAASAPIAASGRRGLALGAGAGIPLPRARRVVRVVGA
jgi:hypothetical protein